MATGTTRKKCDELHPNALVLCVRFAKASRGIVAQTEVCVRWLQGEEVSGPLDPKLVSAEIHRMMSQELAFSRLAKAETERRWKAAPWRTRARIRIAAWIDMNRTRLGEFIGGRRFED